jgi:hypothetical protein
MASCTRAMQLSALAYHDQSMCDCNYSCRVTELSIHRDRLPSVIINLLAASLPDITSATMLIHSMGHNQPMYMSHIS